MDKRDCRKKSQTSTEYSEIKSEYMVMWRDKIFSRDGYKCAVCCMDVAGRLNLAHITSVEGFVRRFHKYVGLQTSIMLSLSGARITLSIKLWPEISSRSLQFLQSYLGIFRHVFELLRI